MYVAKFCPHCASPDMESRCDAVCKCQRCDHVFVVLDLDHVVKLHQTAAQLFVEDVVQSLGRCTSSTYTAMRKGGDS